MTVENKRTDSSTDGTLRNLEAMEVPYIKRVRYSHKTKRYSST